MERCCRIIVNHKANHPTLPQSPYLSPAFRGIEAERPGREAREQRPVARHRNMRGIRNLREARCMKFHTVARTGKQRKKQTALLCLECQTSVERSTRVVRRAFIRRPLVASRPVRCSDNPLVLRSMAARNAARHFGDLKYAVGNATRNSVRVEARWGEKRCQSCERAPNILGPQNVTNIQSKNFNRRQEVSQPSPESHPPQKSDGWK